MDSINNTISSFNQYLEELCSQHKDVLHTPEKRHFIRLCAEEQLSARKTICLPVIALDKLTVSYKGQEDSVKKHRFVELLFLDNVSDAGDFNQICNVWDRMEKIADDFLLKMKEDRKDKTNYPFLKNFSIDGAELEYLENVGTLWGVILSIEIPVPFIECIDRNLYLKRVFGN